VELPFPVAAEADIDAAFASGLARVTAAGYPAGSLRLASLDHISSLPALVLPVHEGP